tara:strand:- start:3752 stop:4636 length:885 start_codon:yes stop_codon:yes gene_type:complete
MVFRTRWWLVEHLGADRGDTSSPPSGTRRRACSFLLAAFDGVRDGTQANASAGRGAANWGGGVKLDDSLLPELEYIGVLIESIEQHWHCLHTPFDPLGFEPAPFYLAWLGRYFGSDWVEDERFRKALLADPALVPCPVAEFVPVLHGLAREPLPVDAHLLASAGVKRMAARNAGDLAEKACKGPLSRSELNALGWHLTTLVALGDDSLRLALRGHARSSGRKGGQRSAVSRAENFNSSAAATCRVARVLLNDRALEPARLVSILGRRLNLVAPTIRKHLRTEGLYPETKKRNPS